MNALVHIDQYNTDKQGLEKYIEDVNNKIRDTIGLVTSANVNTKIDEVENKIPDTGGLETKSSLNTKIEQIENKLFGHAKCISTPTFNKFTSWMFDSKLKQATWATNIGPNYVSQGAKKQRENRKTTNV